MGYLQIWEEHVETNRKMSRCKRVIELFGYENIFEKLEEEYFEVDNEIDWILTSVACNYDDDSAISDEITELAKFERQNEMMYDIFKAYYEIANGKIDTDTMAYSKKFNLKKCEDWYYKAEVTYLCMCNKIKSIKLLVACTMNSNDENKHYSKPIIEYVNQGLSIEEIAAKLLINQDTVEAYILALLKRGRIEYDRFAVDNVTERDVLNALDLIGDDNDKIDSIKELLDESISDFDIEVILTKNQITW